MSAWSMLMSFSGQRTCMLSDFMSLESLWLHLLDKITLCNLYGKVPPLCKKTKTILNKDRFFTIFSKCDIKVYDLKNSLTGLET